MNREALVSVIVPTKNSARFLTRCVASVRAQTYAHIELIVVDNRSDDGTWELALALADRAIQAGPERCAQCNAGAREARGDFLYRADADFVLQPTVVAEAVAACDAGCDAVCIPNRSEPTVSFWSAVRDFERRMYDGSALHSGARFFRREAFDAIGGFDETLVAGEDYDISNRLARAGRDVGWIDASETHVGEPSTLREIAAKSYFYGTVFWPFLRKSGARGLAQVGPIRVAYAKHWRDFCRHPVLAAGFAVMQAVKYVSGAAGLAVGAMRGSGRSKSDAARQTYTR